MRPRLISCLPILLASCAGSAPQRARTAALPPDIASTRAAGPRTTIDPSLMDPSVPPCDDFYRYACGRWLATTPIPDDQGWWMRGYSDTYERNESALRRILEEDAAGRSDAPFAKQLGDFYAVCSDEGAIERAGMAPLKEELRRIDAVTDARTLSREMGHLHSIGIDAAFMFGSEVDPNDTSRTIGELQPSGLGLPERSYYASADKRIREIRTQYADHIGRVLKWSGQSAGASVAGQRAAMKLETKLAAASLTAVQQRDIKITHHPVALEWLLKVAPGIWWREYFTALGTPSDVGLTDVTQPDHLVALSALFKEAPISEWRAYLRYRLIDGLADALPEAIRSEAFAFQQLFTGAKSRPPRWKVCTRVIDRLMGEALAIPFVREHLGEDGKRTARQMVEEIELAMTRRLETLSWIDETTRAAALKKVEKINNLVGYPDVWRSYDGLEITRGSYLASLLAATRREVGRDLAKVGARTNRGEWPTSPSTTDAFCSAANSIIIPAGILQPPRYAKDASDAVNFGAIGATIGHEITHGFDDRGRQYDADGNLREWWTPAMSAEFDQRAACVVRQYDDYLVDDVHVNGRLTLSENVADLGGLELAYQSFKSARRQAEGAGESSDDQEFFVGFAQSWCASFRPERARVAARTDPHSPPRYRVNGPLSNMPEFAHAFSCVEGSKMVRSPEERCKVW
jgi:putative endopeptidase